MLLDLCSRTMSIDRIKVKVKFLLEAEGVLAELLSPGSRKMRVISLGGVQVKDQLFLEINLEVEGVLAKLRLVGYKGETNLKLKVTRCLVERKEGSRTSMFIPDNSNIADPYQSSLLSSRRPRSRSIVVDQSVSHVYHSSR